MLDDYKENRSKLSKHLSEINNKNIIINFIKSSDKLYKSVINLRNKNNEINNKILKLENEYLKLENKYLKIERISNNSMEEIINLQKSIELN